MEDEIQSTKTVLTQLDTVIELLENRKYNSTKEALKELRTLVTDLTCPICNSSVFLTKEAFEKNFVETFTQDIHQEIEVRLEENPEAESSEPIEAILELPEDHWDLRKAVAEDIATRMNSVEPPKEFSIGGVAFAHASAEPEEQPTPKTAENALDILFKELQ